MHGCMSVLTLGASVDSAGCVPLLAQPILCPTPPVHRVYRQHIYIMLNMVTLLGQVLQMLISTLYLLASCSAILVVKCLIKRERRVK